MLFFTIVYSLYYINGSVRRLRVSLHRLLPCVVDVYVTMKPLNRCILKCLSECVSISRVCSSGSLMGCV